MLQDGVLQRPTEYHQLVRKYSDSRQSTSAICANIVTADRVRDATGWNTLTADRVPDAIRWNTLTGDRIPISTRWNTLTADRVFNAILRLLFGCVPE